MANTLLDGIIGAINPVSNVMRAYDWLDETVGPKSHERESMRISQESGLPYEPGLVDVSMDAIGGGVGLAKGLAGRAMPSYITRAEESANWAKGADKEILTNGVPNTYYHASKRAKDNVFPSNPPLRPPKEDLLYQGDGWRFVGPNARGVEQYGGRDFISPLGEKYVRELGIESEINSLLNPKLLNSKSSNIRKIRDKYGHDSELTGIVQGEGNTIQSQLRAKNIWNPDNPKHLEELNQWQKANNYSSPGTKFRNADSPLSDMTNRENGWTSFQGKSPNGNPNLNYQYLDEMGYDAAFGWEQGFRDTMLKDPSLIRNVFDKVDLTNPSWIDRLGTEVGGIPL